MTDYRAANYGTGQGERIQIRLRRLARLGLTGALIVTLLTSVLAGSGARAMTNGIRASAPPWIALIITNHLLGLSEEPLCSGAVVGDGWVLTAAHCVTNQDGGVVSPSSLRVLVGRDARNAKAQGAAYGIARIVRMPGFVHMKQNDAALIQLQNFDSDRWHALPLAFEPEVINKSGGVTLYGYGNTGWNALNRQAGAGMLYKSPDGAFVRDPSCDGQFICLRRTAATRVMQGDSGGSWLRWVDGAWQLIGVNDVVRGITRESPGDPAGATSPLVHLPGGQTMLGWVRDTAALPNPPVGTIVRNLHTGASWLVGSDHYRRWISTGAVYQCLAGQGHRVFNADQIAIDSIPDRVGVHATCKTTATSGDFLLRITPDRVSSQLGAWQTGANGTYVSARRAYGFPDSCSVTPSRREIYAGWNEKLPVGWVFQLAPGWPLPTAYQVCKGLAPAAFFDRGGCIDRRCLTAEGLRFGDPVTKLRQLYPNATTHYMYNELRYWLVTDASGQPLLSVSTSNDRVGTFWVNLHLWQR